MRIGNFRWDEHGETVRAVATIAWEDSNRGTQDVYFATGRPHADSVTLNPNAFLVAAILPAMRHGEARIAVDADVCPELKLGLNTAMRLIRFWYGPDRRPVAIEARTHTTSQGRHTRPRAAFCYTGGVDSLATLRLNRLNVPEQHPGAFRDGVIIFGLEVDRLESFRHVTDVLAPLASEAALTMVPVYTNVRCLDEDWAFWNDEFESAVLASTAHALSRRISSLAIGSSFDYPFLHPHGSHPLLDANYSSSDVQIRHDAPELSRLEKVRMLANWDAALRSLRVCNQSDQYRPGVVNCGRCEKCLRTLTALLIAGRLDAARTFAHRDVTPDLLLHTVELGPTSYPFWVELVEPLAQAGRDDLARAVRRLLARYRSNGGVKQSIVRFDRRYLGGALYTLKQTLAPSAPVASHAR